MGLLWGWSVFWTWIVVVLVQLCEYTPVHWIIHSKWVGSVVGELFIKKAVFLKEIKILILRNWKYIQGWSPVEPGREVWAKGKHIQLCVEWMKLGKWIKYPGRTQCKNSAVVGMQNLGTRLFFLRTEVRRMVWEIMRERWTVQNNWRQGERWIHRGGSLQR